MEENNLFKYADKELAIDAFLCWLINEMNSDDLSELKESFLNEFLALNQKDFGSITELEANKQVNFVDVICTLKTDKGDKKIVFENKMYSTEHSKQLERYKEGNKDAIEFIYLKFGYIHRLDKKTAEAEEYKIKSAEDFSKLIEPFCDKCTFIKEFHEYLNKYFVEPQSKLDEYLLNNNYKQLDNASFQQFIMDKIREKMLKSGWDEDDLKFKIGNNPDGSPWSQLDFSQIENKYGELNETLFFRLDKRSGKYYLRVNLYSQKGNEHWSEKKTRSDELRKAVKQALDNTNLKPGKCHNRAKNEVETVIIFFEDGNSIQAVIDESVKLATALRNAHKKLG